MTTAQQNRIKARELDAKADTLHIALLAPSMREDSLRAESKRLRDEAAEQEAAAAEYGRLASQC
jgi:hypothetical protein